MITQWLELPGFSSVHFTLCATIEMNQNSSILEQRLWIDRSPNFLDYWVQSTS